MKGKKSTKALITARVSEIAQLLTAGATRTEILQYAAKEGRFKDRDGDPWGVSERTVDIYIQRAYEEFAVKTEEQMARERNRAHMRYTAIYRNAMKKERYEAAVAAEKERCKLLGLNAPEKIDQRITGKDGGPVLLANVPDDELIRLLKTLPKNE